MDSIAEDLTSLIYYGSPNKLVYFEKVTGKTYHYGGANDFVNKLNNQSRCQTLKYRMSQSHLGKEYENLIMPCTPANDIIPRKLDSDLDESNNESEDLVSHCLIKCNSQSQGRIKGFQSGIRSAIVKWNDGKYYRLKGCGNLNDGFTLREMGMPKGAIEVRGCAFKHTTIRELYMSELIGKTLLKNNFETANTPRGFWQYGPVENKELGLKDEMPFIDKYCGIFEVRGERRMGAHLLPGVETIVVELIKNSLNNLQFEDFKKLFKNIRISNKTVRFSETEQIDFDVTPTMDCVPFFELEPNQKMNEFIEKNGLYADNSDLTDLFSLYLSDTLSVHETHFYKDVFSTSNLKVVLKALYQKYKVDAFFTKYESQIDNLCEQLNSKNMHFLDLVGLLYARIGWEVGRIKRIMQDNDINWGTYEDQPFRIHGNAHCDNFIMLPRGKSSFKNLLAALDFDLAFTRENFINIRIDIEPEKYGKPDDSLFELYFNVERQYLEWEIVGQENLLVYERLYKDEFNANKKLDTAGMFAIYLLRDTMDLHYRQGYLMKNFDYQDHYEKNYDLLYDLVDSGLLVSVDVIG